jgi:hypothetical protein
MRKPAAVPVVLILVWSLACAKEERMASEPLAPQDTAAVASQAEPRTSVEAAAPAPPARLAVPAAESRKLIRTVDLQVRVRSSEAAAHQVQALTAKVGGYVSEMNAQRLDDGLLYYQISLRVPAARLDETLAAIRKLADEVEGEHQRVEDVTDRFVDLEARLRTLQATERELLALLAESRQRQSGAEDIMAIYRQLTDIRTQIEQIQGERDALGKMVSLSTINLRLTPTEAARPLIGDGWQPGDTARGSVRILLALLRGIGDFLIFAVIVLLPLGLLFWLVYRVFLRERWRARRERRAASRAAPPPIG